jgi:hypothetical protein
MEAVLVFERGNGLLTKVPVWQGFSGRNRLFRLPVFHGIEKRPRHDQQ